VQLVPRCEFWDSLTQADQSDFLRRGVTRRFDPGQALFHANEVPDRVLLLRFGRVKIMSTTATGREAVLAFREPGELIGELSTTSRGLPP
jgi:CRP-like cAMP-binding protein